jgi:uncharacterized protein (TIGR02246 family)
MQHPQRPRFRPRPALPRPVAIAAIALWLIPGVPGCRPRASAAADGGRGAISHVISSYLDAYRRNDPDAIAGLYADDAVLLPPGHELVRGRDDIRKYWSGGMEGGFAMDTVRIEVGGGSGYVVGRYYVPPDAEDDAETGKFVIAVKREADGVWRITADIWNADADSDDDSSPADSTTHPVAML